MKRALKLSLFVAVLTLSTAIIFGQSNEKDTRNVSGFTQIGFGVAGNLNVKIGPEFSVVLEGNRDFLSEIQTVVRNGKLVIRNESNRLFNNEKVNVYITLPGLDGLSVSGSGIALVESKIKNEALSLNVSGSGKILMSEIVTGSLSSSISGSGDIVLKERGEMGKGDISISGSGNFSGETARFKDLQVGISGSGSCKCNVMESINASISGSGNVNYSGNPRVNARVSGSGRVRSR